MNRRGFLSSIIALSAAPAIVRADSLMRIVDRETFLIRPYHSEGFNNDFIFYGDGFHDDTQAIQGWVNGKRVYYPDGRAVLSIPSDGKAKHGPIDLGSRIILPTQQPHDIHYYKDGPVIANMFPAERLADPRRAIIEALDGKGDRVTLSNEPHYAQVLR